MHPPALKDKGHEMQEREYVFIYLPVSRLNVLMQESLRQSASMLSQAECNWCWAQWPRKEAHTERKRDQQSTGWQLREKGSRVTLSALWMGVRYNLGAHRAETGKRNPLRWAPVTWTWVGNTAADLNGTGREYDLGIESLLGRAGHSRGRENAIPQTPGYYTHT